MTQGKATLELPADLAPGAYRAVVLIETPERGPGPCPAHLLGHDVGPWPEGFTVRREEIYGDDGR